MELTRDHLDFRTDTHRDRAHHRDVVSHRNEH